MSAKISGLIWDEPLEPLDKLVLLAYADHADHRGYNVRPSVELIAKKTRMTPRGVQKIVQRLRAAGYMIPVRFLSGGRGHTTEYRIALPPEPPTKGEPDDTLCCADTVDDAVPCAPEPASRKGEPDDTLSGERVNGETSFAAERVNGETQKGEPRFTPTQILNQNLGKTQDKPGAGSAPAHEAPASSLPTPAQGGHFMPPDFTPSAALLAQITTDCPHLDVGNAIKRCMVTTFRRAILDPGYALHKFCLEEEARQVDHERRHPARASPAPLLDERFDQKTSDAYRAADRMVRRRYPEPQPPQDEERPYASDSSRLLPLYRGPTADGEPVS